MKRLKSEVKKHKLFIGYVLFAGIATVVDMGILYFLTKFAGLFYLLSATISYTLGIITNYSLNKKYNFENKDKRVIRQFSIFVSIALIGLLLNNLILFLLVHFAHMWFMFAKVISIGLVMFWSFFGHKHVTFRK